MSTASGNIFLTTENLAFSLPLISVCAIYAYFKFIPLYIGLPLLGGIVLLYQIRAGLTAIKTKKLENLDEQALNDLALELEGDATTTTEAEETANKKIAKKKATIQRKQEIDAKRKKQTGDADDDGDVAAVGKKKN